MTVVCVCVRVCARARVGACVIELRLAGRGGWPLLLDVTLTLQQNNLTRTWQCLPLKFDSQPCA